MRDAPLAIKNVVLEIINFRCVLIHLKDILERDANSLPPLPHDLREGLARLLQGLMDINLQLSETLLPYMDLSTERRLSAFLLQLKWVLGKEKDVEKLRRHLESHKNTMGLILGMMSNLYLAQILDQLNYHHRMTNENYTGTCHGGCLRTARETFGRVIS
ncbi:hypothetical protein BDZ91DRAFT_751903 [Kalaharituber pfeilii]|nr:hypothetical protein BDZ91DRAFT_751903 [Kalaharituber pfeilii]